MDFWLFPNNLLRERERERERKKKDLQKIWWSVYIQAYIENVKDL